MKESPYVIDSNTLLPVNSDVIKFHPELTKSVHKPVKSIIIE